MLAFVIASLADTVDGSAGGGLLLLTTFRFLTCARGILAERLAEYVTCMPVDETFSTFLNIRLNRSLQTLL